VTSLVFATVLCAATSVSSTSDTATYAQAHRITTKTGKPMVIMVATDWCGPCQNMKRNVLPKVRKRGMLSKVAFAVVNADRQGKLAKKLTGGGPVPQLIMYRKSANGWKRRKLVGGQSVEKVETFIKQGLAMDRADKKAAKEASLNNRQTAGKIKTRQVSNDRLERLPPSPPRCESTHLLHRKHQPEAPARNREEALVSSALRARVGFGLGWASG